MRLPSLGDIDEKIWALKYLSVLAARKMDMKFDVVCPYPLLRIVACAWNWMGTRHKEVKASFHTDYVSLSFRSFNGPFD